MIVSLPTLGRLSAWLPAALAGSASLRAADRNPKFTTTRLTAAN